MTVGVMAMGMTVRMVVTMPVRMGHGVVFQNGETEGRKPSFAENVII